MQKLPEKNLFEKTEADQAFTYLRYLVRSLRNNDLAVMQENELESSSSNSELRNNSQLSEK